MSFKCFGTSSGIQPELVPKSKDTTMNIDNIIRFKLPDYCKVIKINQGIVTVERTDLNGFKVFLNEKDLPILNEIRIFEQDPSIIILAVGFFRGLQIANNYNEKYYKANVDYLKLFKSFCKSLKIKGKWYQRKIIG